MISLDPVGIKALRNVLGRMEYVFTCKTLRRTSDFLDPWYDYETMKKCLGSLDTSYRNMFFLFALGQSADYEVIEAEIGKDDLEKLLSTGIWYKEDGQVKTNNYVILYYQGMVLVTEINPWLETCTNRNTDVYIGVDSLRLAENIPYRRGAKVLDLCSGTSIQGLMAAKSAAKVVSVEINKKTVPITKFNVLLNGMEDIVEVREGDLYTVLKDDEKFDCIYANPPFIPMLDTVDYPICGGGGEDGLMVLRKILAGIPQRLNKDGEVIIFCECLGNDKEVFFDTEVETIAKQEEWSCFCTWNDRIIGGRQIELLAGLTELFNKTFDAADFKAKMREIYQRYKAEYLYSLIYKFKADGGNGKLQYIDVLNHWHYKDKAKVRTEFTGRVNERYVDYYLGEKYVGSCNFDTYEFILHLRAGMSIEAAAKMLYFKYRGLMGKDLGSYYGYLQNLIVYCPRFESEGIIEKR